MFNWVNSCYRHSLISLISLEFYIFKWPQSSIFSLGKGGIRYIWHRGYILFHLAMCQSKLFPSLGSLSSREDRELLQRLPIFWIHSSPHNWPVSKSLNFSAHKSIKVLFWNIPEQNSLYCTHNSNVSPLLICILFNYHIKFWFCIY